MGLTKNCEHQHPVRLEAPDGTIEYICGDCRVLLNPPEQANEAEQGHEPYYAENAYGVPLTQQPAQPPAGDVVERMMEAHYRTHWPNWRRDSTPEEIQKFREDMTAALAVAQQERDAQWEMAIRGTWYDKYVEGNNFEGFIEDIRNRLAKPAEQTDVQKVEEILRRDWSKNGITYPQLAAEIVSALKAGKQC